MEISQHPISGSGLYWRVTSGKGKSRIKRQIGIAIFPGNPTPAPTICSSGTF